jgi:hypothetical protein
MIHLDALELIPLVEFEPALFRRADRTTPNDAEGWERYWVDSLADAGIVGLKPFLGSWYVATSDLVDAEHLVRLLETWIESCEAWDGDPLDDGTRGVRLDQLIRLYGGCGLQSQQDVCALPGCCSDLGTIEEWAKASAYRGEIWEMVWIGHPWISVRYSEGLLIFSKPHESDFPDDWFSIDPGALHLAIDFARVALKQFELRLMPIVERLVPRSQVRDVVRILVRGDGAV